MDIRLAEGEDFHWCQRMVTEHHYLHKPVDPRSRPLAYAVLLGEERVGCLIFGRPESTRCYKGELTYGSLADVAPGRAKFDRWEILNLARVWLSPDVQAGGRLAERAPGFRDRKGVWRTTVASAVIGLALARVGFDYLARHPPCFVEEPYEIRAVLSYCNTALHKGTIYRASGFALARRNEEGVETYYTTAVGRLRPDQDAAVRDLAESNARSRRVRAARKTPARTLFD